MRLSIRLALSYIGFLVLLAFLVLVLIGLQITRLTNYVKDFPSPASPGDAAAIGRYLGETGLQATIPAEYLADTLAADGWAQIVDAFGQEVQAVNAPPDRAKIYSPAHAALLPGRNPDSPWFYEVATIGPEESPQGLVILAAPGVHVTPLGARPAPNATDAFIHFFLGGVGMAVVAAVVLALLAGFWYAYRLTRPIVRLAAELKVAAAGDFSHRVEVKGHDEFATLAAAYNHLVERLADANAQRDRMEAARRDLVANISHDLRTPLTSIQGFTEAMVDESTTAAVRRQHAATVAARVRQLDLLLGDLLELSRLQTVPGVQRVPTDLPELVRRQVIALMPDMEAAGLEVDVDLPEDLPPVPVDARLMGRALTNLLFNALRHSGGARRLAVGLMRSGTGIALTVSDDGQGISAADLPNLFDRYYRGTSATNRQQGSGLGLAIVKQIAENHQGRVTVASTEGKGTTFTLWLPL